MPSRPNATRPIPLAEPEDAAPAGNRFLRLLGIWLMSDDHRQRTYAVRYFIGVANCIAGVAALNYGVHVGVIEAEGTRILTWAASAVMLGFYLILRTGLNKRLADPAMTEAKMLATISFLAAGYYLGDIGRSVALILLVVTQMSSMFESTPPKVARTSAYALVVFGFTMHAVAKAHPLNHEPELQIVYFFLLAIILPTTTLLAYQLHKIRNALRRRKNELEEALQRIQVLATRDELTGLVNRRHMGELVAAQIARMERGGEGFCLCLLDIDHFKSINDTHGHGVGDEVLQVFARKLLISVRDTDVVARWGGEEFLLMLPHADAHSARLSVERARQEMARTCVSEALPELRVSFSAGLTAYRSGEPLQAAIERADHALYAAKAGGRNRSLLDTDVPPSAVASPRQPAAPVSVVSC
jgi:diguanylate cyclase (GGDEF)-like protein